MATLGLYPVFETTLYSVFQALGEAWLGEGAGCRDLSQAGPLSVVAAREYGKQGRLVGVITARVRSAAECSTESGGALLGAEWHWDAYERRRVRHRPLLVYILTLGVLEPFRTMGPRGFVSGLMAGMVPLCRTGLERPDLDLDDFGCARSAALPP